MSFRPTSRAPAPTRIGRIPIMLLGDTMLRRRAWDTVRGIGADYVIDYSQEDFTRTRPRYDLILEAE